MIAGHTDNVPVNGGPFQSNLRLSLARSAAVAEFFIGRGYLSPQRVVTMGFGKYRPIDTNDTAKGREKNRRVEIVMTTVPQTGQAVNEPSCQARLMVTGRFENGSNRNPSRPIGPV